MRAVWDQSLYLAPFLKKSRWIILNNNNNTVSIPIQFGVNHKELAVIQ